MNEPAARYVSKARDELAKHNFESVFTLTGQPHPKTFPTEPYAELYGAHYHLALDDILVRGNRIKVLGAGVLERVVAARGSGEQVPVGVPIEATDHDGVWATLEI